jgi:hypothetical protein
MPHRRGPLLALLGALLLLVAPVGAAPTVGPVARLEWQINDSSAPYPAIVAPTAALPWFGYAGYPVYVGWQPGDPAARIYLPPAGCPDPNKPCASICPPSGPGCFTAWVTYRLISGEHSDDQVVLRLPNTLPFFAGWPGDAVTLAASRDGGLWWVLP